MELDWTVQMARNYFAKPEPGSGWRDVPNGHIGRVLIAENDRLIARVEELEAAIQRACADDICPWARCHEDCPLYPYRGGQ